MLIEREFGVRLPVRTVGGIYGGAAIRRRSRSSVLMSRIRPR